MGAIVFELRREGISHHHPIQENSNSAMFDRDRRNLIKLSTELFPNQVFDPILSLAGDASTRRYYRGISDQGSWIGQINEPFSEEGPSFNFIEVTQHLEKSGILVPKIYGWNSETGVILMEDHGDVTLLRRLQEVYGHQEEELIYKEVVRILADMHAKASREEGFRINAFNLAFDYEKFKWEIEFTLKYFFEEHLSRSVSSRDREVFNFYFDKLCNELILEPLVFTHRDFHSRNILVNLNNDYVFIDYQDARMGLRQYDLCSLLRDSYYQLEESAIYELCDFYMEYSKENYGIQFDKKRFIKIFDLCTVQRNFKAIGTFCYIEKVRKNNLYLKYIGNTFENIRKVLIKYSDYSDLRTMLHKYYYF